MHDGVVEDVAWHLRHEYYFGSVGDDHYLLLWDLRTTNNKPVKSVVAHQGEVSMLGQKGGSYFLVMKFLILLVFGCDKILCSSWPDAFILESI